MDVVLILWHIVEDLGIGVLSVGVGAMVGWWTMINQPQKHKKRRSS